MVSGPLSVPGEVKAPETTSPSSSESLVRTMCYNQEAGMVSRVCVAGVSVSSELDFGSRKGASTASFNPGPATVQHAKRNLQTLSGRLV